MRTTKKDIRNTVERLNRKLTFTGKPKIDIDSAYGQYRIEFEGGKTLSPRLPTGQLAQWLDGFESALDNLVS